MEKHFIDIFVPHRKLRKVYYLVSALLLLLWIPDLNKLNIPLPSKVLEAWFLDKLLLTTIALTLLYSFSAYYLSRMPENKLQENTKSTPEKSEKPEEDQKRTLSESHEKILELLFKKPLTVEFISTYLKLTKEETKYYLNDLWGKDMVQPPAPYSSSNNWRIDQEGREYVMMKQGKV